MKENAADYFKKLQDNICAEFSACDLDKEFREDCWERPDGEVMHGGGGRTRILHGPKVFEQAGVNFSQVHGTLPAKMCKALLSVDNELPFFATGTSLVCHPHSPKVPTTHANFRFLQVGDFSWFGGGMDLTPYYLYTEDCEHFHRVIKNVCDNHDPEYYPRFKKWCDEYFYLPHREETRGIGGLFFDYLGKDGESDLEQLFSFVQEIGNAFTEAYMPIVNKRKEQSYSEQNRDFQLLRRGRYVEFNLLYDRGTQFGLQTGGRTESILMSLPPKVRFEYCAEFKEGSEEHKLIETLKNPQDWV